MDNRYPAILTPQVEGGYLVQFVDLDEAFTEGETLEEALFNAAEVLTLTLDGRMEEGQPIPAPSAPSGAEAHAIAPSARTQAALLVRRARADRPLADLARALDTSWPAAKRLEDPHHSPTLKQLERAAAALGKRLVLTFE
jgi:antitoxin HicB